ncbi:SPRY domain-containing SOCS box protein 3 isoform X2 [Bicyclus anynana]|uniref:SPRY domain-containing SOCS box protein 3 isoform X2 n=1 Tax=Bicyclus anynana TaxID=110368 RepID=A0ABM3LQ65_BICAN|nr:SPRY domain-containing SOCS box protein 3 isoform X2 [Bicyclus anynana]
MYTLKTDDAAQYAKPYCACWSDTKPMEGSPADLCDCGEDDDLIEWKWEPPVRETERWCQLSLDRSKITFHPIFSSGTAAARSDAPLLIDHHYYWEVKMLTRCYGTDIMVGVGTKKVSTTDTEFKFVSLLGQDGESYGLSYKGKVRHDGKFTPVPAGFCSGSIVGVRVDLWHGTLAFYINRKPQGVSFYNLRRHPELYAMLSSTAAQSSMRLIYAASWRASLLVDAAKVLAASWREGMELPPGLRKALSSQFWLGLPADVGSDDEDDDEIEPVKPMNADTSNLLNEVRPTYMNGYYAEGVDRERQLVVWE